MLVSVGLYELLAAVLVLLFVYFRRNRENLPPGPWGLPVFGYLPFVGKYPSRSYFELSKKYGPIINVKLGSKNVVVLNDYESIQEALVKQSDVFSDRPRNEFIHKISEGYGMIFRKFNEEYKIHRKFTLTTLRGLGFGKRGMESKIVEEIENLCDEIGSRNGKPFHCQDTLVAAVSNVICNVVLGSRFSYDDEDFKGMLKAVNALFSDKVYAFCVNMLILAPQLRFIPPFSTAHKRIFEDIDYVVEILRKILEEHKRSLDPDNPRDFIDHYLIRMQSNDTNDVSFCEEQLYQILRDLFVAGTETTSSTLRWAVLVFAHRPDIQRKVHEEVKQVIGVGLPSMKHKDGMPYVSAFILELMRHRTLVPLAVPHATVRHVSFRGYDLAKGQMVLANIWAVHHDPKNFENPSEFNPERFLDGDGTFNKNPRVIPFSVGPRSCLGEQLARMEIFLFLTSIVQRFEIVADSSRRLPELHDGNSGIAEVPTMFHVSFKNRL